MITFFILVFIVLLILLIALIPFYGKIGDFVLKLFSKLDEEEKWNKKNDNEKS